MNLTTITAFILVLLLIAISVPLPFLMPTMMQMAALVVIAVLVAAYAGLILAERGGDERDMLHRANAGRAGFLVGVITLTFALLMQGLSHAIDPWVPAALSAMIVAKAAARAAASRNN